MGKEIERQWLIRALVSMDKCSHASICQSYIVAEDNKEVRIREKSTDADETSYKLTLKSGKGLSRTEVEVDLTCEQYTELLLNMIGNHAQITKDYYKMTLPDGHVFEQSCVDNGAFCYAEVEFASEQDAAEFKFPFPEVMIEEVTHDEFWKMKNYWIRTRINKK